MVLAFTIQMQRLQLDAAGPDSVHVVFAGEFCSFDLDYQHLKSKSLSSSHLL